MKRILCAWAVLGSMLLPAAGAELTAANRPIYVIPIKDMIERALVYAVRRGVEEAVRNNAAAIVIDMDTPGGRLDAAEEIVELLAGLDIPTYTYVNPNAISAGAIIAMSTDHIFMAPGGRIGDAMPIMMSPLPMGPPQAIPGDLKEKAVSPTAALIRSAAQRKGHDPELAEAMVRAEKGYTSAGKVICPTNQLVTLTASEAEQMVGEEGKQQHLLSEGTLKTLDELLKQIEGSRANVVVIEITAAERIARVIDGFPWSGIILALGLLLLYIEFKTPGVILPGIIGTVLLAVWFWGHHIAGMAGIMEILLFAAGVGLLLTEVLFFPTLGILGVFGVVMMVAGLIMATLKHHPELPWWQPPQLEFTESIKNFGVAATLLVILGALTGRFLPRTRLFHQLTLETSVSSAQGYQAAKQDTSLIGLKGTAESQIRPAGIAVFGARRLNVVSRGQFIEKDASVTIVEVHGNRIVVDPA